MIALMIKRLLPIVYFCVKKPKSRERESLQKKRKYEQLSKEERRVLTIATLQRRKARIAKMNEEQFMNYKKQRNKWQQNLYNRKMVRRNDPLYT